MAWSFGEGAQQRVDNGFAGKANLRVIFYFEARFGFEV